MMPINLRLHALFLTIFGLIGLMHTAAVPLTAQVDCDASGKICKVRQELRAGTEVDTERQRLLGLVTVNGSCSGTLLNDFWVLTARHCVTISNVISNPFVAPNQITITATWAPGRRATAERVHDFKVNTAPGSPKDRDIVLIYLGTTNLGEVNHQTIYAVSVRDGSGSVLRSGKLKPEDVVTQYGTGYSTFATSTPVMRAIGLGTYRSSQFSPSSITDTHYNFDMNSSSQVGHGGDSGGPSWVTVGGVGVGIAGVQTTCLPTGYVAMQPSLWEWATGIRYCTYVSTAPFLDEISDTIREKPSPPFTGRHKAVYEDSGFPTGIGNVDENILYGVQQDGQLIWHRHFIDRRGGGLRHAFQPTKKVGDGWKIGLQGVYPAGAKAIYMADDKGVLRWYWHHGAFDGSYDWAPPQQVGIGWSGFRIIPMDNGVVYTIGAGTSRILRWQRHHNYLTGKDGVGGWQDSKPVHDELWKYIDIFSGGNGVIYAVTMDGELHWYRHKDYLNPLPMQAAQWRQSWEGPKKVGDGWHAMKKIFSSGGGHIYAITAEGDLLYYRHLGYTDGTYRWDARAQGKIATGWNGYVFAFARITTSDPAQAGPN